MRLLCLGDVFGSAAVSLLSRRLGRLSASLGADCCVLNAENAEVTGLSRSSAEALLNAGADVLTLGNHAFSKRELSSYIDEQPRIIRPLNFSPLTPGGGSYTITLNSGKTLCVVCLIGRALMSNYADSPFDALDKFLAKQQADFYAIEIHAEATSEKMALAHCYDGRVSVVYGTHTHVQTADERVLPNGTGYITDLGMCGPENSVLGIVPKQAINRLRGGLHETYKAAEGALIIRGALFELDDTTGRCCSVRRVALDGNIT